MPKCTGIILTPRLAVAPIVVKPKSHIIWYVQRHKTAPSQSNPEAQRKLFPLPESLGGSRWDYEDASERARFDAIERLRYELEHKVYPACDRSRFTDSEGDDALDPVIDYKELKGQHGNGAAGSLTDDP